jgi:hypothetical protein
LKERKERYSQADVQIEITEDMDQEEVADEIIPNTNDFIDDNPPA